MNNEDKEREEQSEIPLLPVLADTEPHNTSKDRKGIRFLRLAAALCLVGVVAALAWMLMPEKEEQPPLYADTQTAETEEEWRGAFMQRDTYEECMAVTVGIRWGQGASAVNQSGFVLSSDGLIATSASLLREGKKGRIYVTMSDGSEYPAESLQLDDESPCAIIKIEAEGLVAARVREAEIHAGEQLVAVQAKDLGFGVAYTQISGMWDTLYFVKESCGEGTPLYDQDGRLAAFVCQTEQGVLAMSARDAYNIFSVMREKQK